MKDQINMSIEYDSMMDKMAKIESVTICKADLMANKMFSMHESNSCTIIKTIQ
jgi:hypothetical protein